MSDKMMPLPDAEKFLRECAAYEARQFALLPVSAPRASQLARVRGHIARQTEYKAVIGQR